MGFIKYFDTFDNVAAKQPIVAKPVDQTFSGLKLEPDAKPITLSEYSRVSKDVWTAHHAADYRRKTFSLVLLPDVDILFDKVLEGSAYWYGKLHADSPYT